MNWCKLLLVFVLLWKATDALQMEENKNNVSFSVGRTWQSFQNKCSCCKCEADSWAKGVQKLVDGCVSSTSVFRGKALELADTAVNSMKQYITKLIEFTNSNSTIVASSSTAMLETFSKCDTLNGTSMYLIVEFGETFPKIIVKEFNEVALKLSDHIGELACSFTKAATELGTALSKFCRDFEQSCRLFNCKRVDFKPVLLKVQNLMNTVALIDQTLLNECENEVTQEVYDSVLVLHLLYFELGLIAVQGVQSCFLDVLYDRDCPVSKIDKHCSLSFEYVLVETTQAVTAVVLQSNNSIKDFMKIFVNITSALNAALKGVLGLFNGVLITVDKIVSSLVKGDKVTVSASNGLTSLLKGVLQN